MDSKSSLIASPVTTVAAVVLVAYWIFSVATSRSKVPENLPWIGKTSNALFAETRATYASFASARQWLATGYEKYSRQGKSYIFPDFSGKPEIIIPNEKLRWLIDHPDTESSVGAAHFDLLCGDYAFTSPYLLKSLYHEHVVHRNLARRLANLIPGTWDELQYKFKTTWPTDGEWKEICVMENMMDMISGVSNRMFVGLPLCRDAGFLGSMSAFATDVIICMTLMGFVPALLKPIMGPILSLPNRWHYRKSAAYTLPVIKQRLADMEHNERKPDSKPIEIPDDYFTWHIRSAKAEGRAKELEPEWISRFLMPIEFAAIHTTTLTISNTLFDLLGSDPNKRFVEGLREEAQRVYKEENGVWTKQGLNKLYRADSAIRESMRVSSFATRGLQRKILAKEGLRNEEEGWTAPSGSTIAVDVWSRHHDPVIYPDPDTYDAFRFSRPREEFESMYPDDTSSDNYLRLKNLSMIATGESFLPFGHGRHACPGRFFVNHELKMLLAYMLMNYDLQYLPERPKNQWFGQTVVPPGKATIKVRRRQAA